jgi:hypothetical protein
MQDSVHRSAYNKEISKFARRQSAYVNDCLAVYNTEFIFFLTRRLTLFCVSERLETVVRLSVES